MDVVLIETVGVGQDEIDIVNAADTSIVVLFPGIGDGIQTMKAGILEIADIFLVNQYDESNADNLLMELNEIIGLSKRNHGSWKVPTLRTEAIGGNGIKDLIDAVH